MALENTIGRLYTGKGDDVKINPKYDSQVFLGSERDLMSLDGADPGTLEGLASFKQITGEDLGGVSKKLSNSVRESVLYSGEQAIMGYVGRHAEGLAGELSPEEQFNLIFGYCPTADSEDKDYNGVRAVVAGSREVIKVIDEKGSEFLTAAISNASPLMASYISRFGAEYLGIVREEAQINAQLAIAKYGGPKFVSGIMKQLAGEHEAVISGQRKKEEEITLKVDMAQANKPGILTSKEYAELVAGKQEEIKQLREAHPEAGRFQPFVQDLRRSVVGALSFEEARKAAEKKAEEELAEAA
jgi:hypothetical protein